MFFNSTITITGDGASKRSFPYPTTAHPHTPDFSPHSDFLNPVQKCARKTPCSCIYTQYVDSLTLSKRLIQKACCPLPGKKKKKKKNTALPTPTTPFPGNSNKHPHTAPTKEKKKRTGGRQKKRRTNQFRRALLKQSPREKSCPFTVTTS